MGILTGLKQRLAYKELSEVNWYQDADGWVYLPVVGDFSSASLELLLEANTNAIKGLEGGYTTLIGKVSGGDFTTAYLAPTQITTGAMPTSHPILLVDDIEKVDMIRAGVTTTYTRDDYVMVVSGAGPTYVLTITGAAFLAGDTFIVYTNISKIANPNYFEDSVHTNGDPGTFLLSVRKDTPVAMTSNDGDYQSLVTDSKGQLYVYDTSSYTYLDDIRTALQIIDDWDETNRCAVNLIAGQVGIQAGSGAFSDSTLRITLATDDPQFGSIGTAADVDGNVHGQLRYIGENINSILVGPLSIEGVIKDDDAASTDAPVKGGTVAESINRSVNDGDVTNLRSTLEGLLKIAGYDTTLASLKTVEQAGIQFYRTTVEHSETLTVGAPTKYYYVIPFDTYKTGSFVSRFVMGAGSSAVVKVYATNDASANISSITIADWFDVSTAIIGAASLAAGAGATTDAVWYVAAQVPMEYYVIEVNYTDAADSTVSIKAKLGY